MTRGLFHRNFEPDFGAPPDPYSKGTVGFLRQCKAAGAWGWPLTSILYRR